MSYELRKINIDPSNVKLFYENFGGTENLTRFVNKILAEFFEGRMVKLEDSNYEIMKTLCKGTDRNVFAMVNLCLSSADFIIKEVQKPKIKINKVSNFISIKKKEN